ncbi:MAG: 7-carboxy-7-deazaguanine synthase QueE [Deltaproteobacteria bacterium]|nr:7-carboxy-7-deazaguanine synthase QueE [Deltaproteobacteria bacterium]
MSLDRVASGAPSAKKTPSVLRLPVHQRLKVNEIFYSIQGESTFAGLPCVLVRLTGCQMRCSWCDTPYSFYEGEWQSLDQILTTVAAFNCPLVELTGGEPLLQPGAETLLTTLCDAGYRVLLETGGGLDISRVDPRVHRIVDVKCPGSGEMENNHWPNLDHLSDRDELKFVVADRRDYEWARDLVSGRPLGCSAIHFSPVHGSVEATELAEWVLEDQLPVRVQLQLHKFLWGAETRGV